MKNRFRRLLAAGCAALVTLTAPVSVAAEADSPALLAVEDYNGDGVIDVFDVLLAKRTAVLEQEPMQITISNAEACPGETVTLTVSLSGTRAIDQCSVTAALPDGLCFGDGSSFSCCDDTIALENTDYNLMRVPRKEIVVFSVYPRKPIKIVGELFEFRVTVPADAVPGTVYSVTSDYSSFGCKGNAVPFLAEHGKITVVQPAVTTTTSTAVTTETTTTTLVTDPTDDPPEVTTVTTVSEPAETTETTETTVSTIPPLCGGVDISAWQGEVDFAALAGDPAVDFVILRAGYGRFLKQEDPMFRTYYDQAKANGLPVGAYWYSYATTPEAAREEARICAEVLGDRCFEYPIAYDIEEPKQLKLGKEKVSALIEAFCSELESMGYFTQLYCSSYYLNHTVAQETLDRYDVWVAHYNVVQPTFTGKFGMWQYGLGTVAGIADEVDVDYCYRDYPSVIKSRHLNGY